jgi:hypothetical protein
MRGLHDEIEFSMMEAGHTKFSPDWHFGLWKVINYMYLKYFLKLHVLHNQEFLAYFIADIMSYSQLEIVYYFPSQHERFPN